MCVIFFVAGSYIASCLYDLAIGNSFADTRLEPVPQNDGLPGGRTADVNHTRPFRSNIGLCTLLRLVQIGSFPQYGDGCGTTVDVRGVAGSRTVNSIRLIWLW